MTESRLVHEIMREVGKYAAVFRCNSGQIRLPSGKVFRGLPAGFSDIMAVLPGGRVAFIECKTCQGKLSPQQEKFIAKMQGLGAIAGVARSPDEALALCGIDTEVIT